MDVYGSADLHELSMLHSSSGLDINVVGDVTATVDGPTDLLAWAKELSAPRIVIWRAHSGGRYIQVTASATASPGGRVSALLCCDPHPHFWNELVDTSDLTAGRERVLSPRDLSRTCAWDAIPPKR
jgi:hypothetical protein